jgi:DNA replication protein DnaC
VCPICGGLGFYTKNVPVDHPDFGKAFRCECQRERLLEQQNAHLRAMSNLDVVVDKTFDSFLLDLAHLSDEQQAILNMAYDRARAYAEDVNGWLLFQGSYGSGKTHLAVAIANHRLSLGEKVLFITVPDLLDHLRATYGPTSQVEYDELFDRVRTFPLLVLDDLGTESATSWAQEKLYQLINHRYLHRLATVITTNAPLLSIDPRIRSRLLDRDLTALIDMPLPDFRQKQSTPEERLLTDLSLYQDQTFDTFDLRERTLPEKERNNLQKIYRIAQRYAQNPEGWLIFIGAHGSGKTHLAAAVANYRHRMGEKVVFVSAPDLLDYLRAAFNPKATYTFGQRFYEIRAGQMLVIDQFDLRNASPWALEKLRQIVNYRYLAKLPTVFTTTQPFEELDPLIRSRLSDVRLCHVLAILAPDYTGGESSRR